jgi:hypothetical protein
LYTVCVVFNFVVVSVYWSVLHPYFVAELRKQPERWPEFVVICLQHSAPALFCVINSHMTNTVLRMHLVKPLWSTYIFYNFVNFLFTKWTGEAIYPFMDWKTL